MEILYTLVTGATGGLGVKELARRSQPLYLTGRSAEKLEALREQLLHSHPALPVRTAVCDLADDGSRRALFAEFARENVRFCRLVYAAGADIQKPLEEYTEEKIAFQTRANFEGAVSLARAVLERSEGVPEVLFVGSVSGLYPMPCFALRQSHLRAAGRHPHARGRQREHPHAGAVGEACGASARRRGEKESQRRPEKPPLARPRILEQAHARFDGAPAALVEDAFHRQKMEQDKEGRILMDFSDVWERAKKGSRSPF